MSGMKIVVAAYKREFGASIDQGKRAVSFEVYKILCEELYNGKVDDHFFAHAFLTMEWNLMKRSNNCANIHVYHIQWRSDSFIYYFGTYKGNQTEDRANDPQRVYSNPNNPKNCPVLDLSKYLFSHPIILTTYSNLFPGNHQYEIFLNIFHRIINNNIE